MPHSSSASTVMPHLYSAEQLRAHERALFAQGETAFGLMSRAGEALWAQLRRHWPNARYIGVLVGSGQNAGDGLVLARLALAAGYTVRLFGWLDVASVRGAAAEAWAALQRDHSRCAVDGHCAEIGDFDVIVDAGFGMGLSQDRPIESPAAMWITQVNRAHAQGTGVMAADLPSGLQADTGAGDLIIEADVTVCFLALKPGLFTGRGPAVAGKVVLADLAQPAPSSRAMAQLMLNVPPLPAKPRDGHKGTFGTVLVIAGNRGMAGAARMAAEAALRVGAGKVIVATHPEHAVMLGIGRPELIVHGVADARALGSLLPLASAVVLGPGLGQDLWSQSLAEVAFEARCPIVVDADGLHFLSSSTSWARRRPAALLITPHPAEAARMLGCTTRIIEHDRLHAARSLSERFGALTVLKGAGSVLALPHRLLICGRGDPALATAGSGDVLAGVIGGLLSISSATGLDPADALMRAVCWHAIAGELLAAERGAWGVAASDLFEPIRALVNGRVTLDSARVFGVISA
ncbi:MAG: NAD(P)H-hydrate dehydratase [Halothiobacillus sp.]